MSDMNDKEKLEQLSYRIRGAERQAPSKSESPSGSRMGVDFVGSIAICGVVGALADRAFKTGPWGLLGMVLFGFVVAMIGAWRTIQKPDSSHKDHSDNRE